MALLLFAATLPPAGAVPAPTAANTLQFYGGEVRAVAQIGGAIYVGGSFTAVGYGSPSIPRSNLAAIDAASGQLVTAFDPHPDNAVNALLASADGTYLYAGGVFNNLRGCSQCDRLAMLDPATGAAVASFGPRPNAAVLSLAQAGNTLFVGGSFTTVAGRRRVRLAAVDATTGRVVGMALHADGAVRDLALNPGGTTLYLAGAFTAIGGTTRYNFASIAVAARTLTAWNPNIHASGWGVALPAGLAIGGDFQRTNGVLHSGFALFAGTA